ncbi:MAG: hypothetical protein ABIF71_08710 [Planctomycetota bacterium]
MRVLTAVALALGLAAAAAGVEPANHGWFRTGAWSEVVPPGPGEWRLTAGRFGIDGCRGFLFQPGLAGADAVLEDAAGGRREPVTGLTAAGPGDRLVLWVGRGVADPGVQVFTIGPFRALVAPDGLPAGGPVLDPVDIIVFEEYPAGLGVPAMRAGLDAWLGAGGTVVITARELIGRRVDDYFAPYFAAGAGRAAAELLGRLRAENAVIAAEEICVIPVGAGRLVLFASDRREMGAAAWFSGRPRAWERIMELSSRPAFPAEAARADIARRIDRLVPMPAAVYAVRGGGTAGIAFTAAVLLLIVTTRGHIRRAALCAAGLCAALAIGLVFRPVPFAAGAVTIERVAPDGTTAVTTVLLKVGARRPGIARFAAAGERPLYPFTAGTGRLAVTGTEAGFTYALTLPVRGSDLLFYRGAVRLEQPAVAVPAGADPAMDAGFLSPSGGWCFDDGTLWRIPGPGVPRSGWLMEPRPDERTLAELGILRGLYGFKRCVWSATPMPRPPVLPAEGHAVAGIALRVRGE